MNALVVGAGSVGRDFAHHLHLGGSEISFLTRTERAPEMGRDLLLIHLNKRNARMNPIHFGFFDSATGHLQQAALIEPPQRPSSTLDSCGQRRFNRHDITDQIFDIGVSSSGQPTCLDGADDTPNALA